MDVRLPTGIVHVEECGSGVPLVILHGGKLDHCHMMDAFEPVFESLSGWRRLYVDLPGHGLSSAGDAVTTQDDVLDILLGFTDTVLPRERYAVIGESRGSYHARGIVHKRPDDVYGMMLICPGGFTEKASHRLPVHQTLVRAGHLRDGLTPDELARFDRLVVQSTEILEKIRRTKIPAAKLADGALEERILSHYEFSFDLEAPERPFDKPCLIVSGRQDAIAGY